MVKLMAKGLPGHGRQVTYVCLLQWGENQLVYYYFCQLVNSTLSSVWLFLPISCPVLALSPYKDATQGWTVKMQLCAIPQQKYMGRTCHRRAGLFCLVEKHTH